MALDRKAGGFQANTSSYLQPGLWDVCAQALLHRPGGSLEDGAKR